MLPKKENQCLWGLEQYSTNSTEDLAFLNNVLGVFKVEFDETGGFTSTEWQWK